ncbi:Transposable element tcb2 transposase [Caligus rogercresseyi]|uniref:Transposable element tcb2 transposase n=1 Tax=Caligus rogercresseyi TaxID=217165 RepID=A0A7T8GXG1_CALRO|nr:Transposable element tcb2 transposase [Caligus rogercresseyi]
MTKLAVARDVSIYTISKAVRENLGYKSFTVRVRHLLTEKQKDARVARGKDMLNFIKSSSSPSLRLFSDEKLFNLDCTHNRQNTRKCPWSSIPRTGLSHGPGRDLLRRRRDGPHFFSVGLRIKQEVYLEVLRDVVVPWMNKVAKVRRYTL